MDYSGISHCQHVRGNEDVSLPLQMLWQSYVLVSRAHQGTEWFLLISLTLRTYIRHYNWGLQVQCLPRYFITKGDLYNLWVACPELKTDGKLRPARSPAFYSQRQAMRTSQACSHPSQKDQKCPPSGRPHKQGCHTAFQLHHWQPTQKEWVVQGGKRGNHRKWRKTHRRKRKSYRISICCFLVNVLGSPVNKNKFLKMFSVNYLFPVSLPTELMAKRPRDTYPVN